MNEFVVANINAHMAEGMLHGVKKHQVTRFELGALNAFRHLGLVGGLSWQDEPHRLLKDGAHKAAAIKARIDVGATSSVGDT